MRPRALTPEHSGSHATTSERGDMTEHNRRILIVDDNRAIHDDVRKILRGRDSEIGELESELFGQDAPPVVRFETSSAYQGEDAVEQVRAALAAGRPFPVAPVDMRMPPGIDG